MNNGNINNNNKTNTNRVRAVAAVPSATPQVVYDIPFSSIIEAWIDCERNKRSSNSCTKFRWHAARDLVELWDAMRYDNYQPRASMVFMATTPVLREIWAGAFRDRVVHHWESLRYGPPLEQYFVEVGDKSMNCRKGYGALRAVKSLQKSICEFTNGYTRDDCYIVGGDFKQFFPSIDKALASEFMEQLLYENYTYDDLPALLHFTHTTINHRPQDNYYCISPPEMWDNYPPTKSLFNSDGFAPGNLISQHVANLVGAVFTLWMIFYKKADGFIIFVDDWRCLVRSKEDGQQLIAEVKDFLKNELHITLHPDKIYLQHYTKGTKFVGAVIKPASKNHTELSRIKVMRKWAIKGLSGCVNATKFKKYLLAGFKSSNTSTSVSRIYISNRTRGQFISAMIGFNNKATSHNKRVALLEKVRASINSYLGMMCHYNSYKVRRSICEKYILPIWGKYIYFEDEFRRCIIRKEYDANRQLRKRLKKRKFAARFIRPEWRPE